MALKLKEWRRIKEISQAEMASMCGVNHNTYRAWEKDPGNIKLNMAFKIADILEVDVHDIIFLP